MAAEAQSRVTRSGPPARWRQADISVPAMSVALLAAPALGTAISALTLGEAVGASLVAGVARTEPFRGRGDRNRPTLV
jgi:hypothetical protein